MSYYDPIDEQFFAWVNAKGYVAQTHYRDEPVRGFVLWSLDHQQKVEIGVSRIEGDDMELSIYGGKRRKKIIGKIAEITKLLESADLLARKWLLTR